MNEEARPDPTEGRLTEKESAAGPLPGSDEATNNPAIRPKAMLPADLTGIFKQVVVGEGDQQAFPHASTKMPRQTGSIRGASTTDMFSMQEPASTPGTENFTQMFAAFKQNRGGSRDDFYPVSQKETPEPNARRTYLRGGINELAQFQPAGQAGEAMDEAVANRAVSFSNHGALPPELESGFTQLLRTLSSETSAEVSTHSPSPIVPSHLEGPGEFTQIISRSMLRESLHSKAQEDLPAESLPPVGAGGSRGSVLPAVSPYSVVSGVQQVSRLAGGEMSGSSISSEVSSGVSALAGMYRPGATPEQSYFSRLQRYVPLLLIANLFAMVLLLLFAGFAIMNHR